MIISPVRIFSVLQRRTITSMNRQSPSKTYQELKEVDIDDSGTFKYILIKVHDSDQSSLKHIVRGYKRCAYHDDIYQEVQAKELRPGRLESRCVGGGRITHDPNGKLLTVYGYSVAYGKADHYATIDLLKKHYPDYEITHGGDEY